MEYHFYYFFFSCLLLFFVAFVENDFDLGKISLDSLDCGFVDVDVDVVEEVVKPLIFVLVEGLCCFFGGC